TSKAGVIRTKCVGNDTQNSYVTVTGQPQDLSAMSEAQIKDLLCSNVVVPVCGNGTVEGSEACDDGNTNNTDSCSNTCTIPPTTEYADCIVYFGGTDYNEYGGGYLDETMKLMKAKFGYKGLEVSSGVGSAISLTPLI